MGILNDNTIVKYDSASVIQSINASLYDPSFEYTDITYEIRFHANPVESYSIAGDSLYHIYAEYKGTSMQNPSIIAYLRRGILDPQIPIAKDSYSGNIFINSTEKSSTYPFMRRENPDDVIIPYSNWSSIDSIHIAWDKSFKIKYAAIANLSYTGFNIVNYSLTSAYHSIDGDVLQNLISNDSLYTYVSPNGYLNLEFNYSNNKQVTGVKDYVIEVNGKVIYLGINKSIKSNISHSQNLVPSKYSLSQNYPNPFNPVTKINYSLPKTGFVSIKIYDMLGREIKTLINEIKQAGNYSVDFNGSNLSSGVYFYRMESGTFSDVKRFILIK